jgi:hypothetical protein
MEEFLNANAHLVQAKVASLGGLYSAAPRIEADIAQQALVMTYNDIFTIMGWAR